MAECIVVGNSGVSEGEIYTSGEINTEGTWIDGRAVYRLIINNVETQNFTVNLSQYITGTLDVLINLDAYIYNPSSDIGVMLSTQSTNNTYGTITKNTQTLTISNNYGGVIKWIILEYVKTD